MGLKPTLKTTQALLQMELSRHQTALQDILSLDAEDQQLPEGAQFDSQRGHWVLPDEPKPDIAPPPES